MKYFCSLHTNITDKVDRDGNSLARSSEVNHKGQGCKPCRADHEKREAKKELQRKKRAAWRNGEKFESEKEDA